MKTLLLLFALVVLAAALPVSAQDSCVTDLSSVAAQILTAQALASSGDIPGSVATIREARAALAAIQTACAEAGVTASVLLDGEFAVPDSPYVFNYPLAWTAAQAQRPTADLVVQPLGNTTRASEQALQGDPVLAPGDQGAFVAIGNGASFGMAADGTPADVVAGIAANLPEGFQAGEVTTTTINGQPAATLRYSGPTAEGYLIVRVVSPELGLVAQVAGVTPAGELDALIPTIDAMARSIR